MFTGIVIISSGLVFVYPIGCPGDVIGGGNEYGACYYSGTVV